MKIQMFLMAILLVACSKKETVMETTQENDSAVVTDQITVDLPAGSQQNGVVAVAEGKNTDSSSGSFKETDRNKIIKTINADKIPITVQDEFVKDDQQFIVKIRNYKGNKISGKIVPENPDMNIRFNRIRLANGEYDGPFGRHLNYVAKEGGEIWLVIGKSNMASGPASGKFAVHLE